MRDSKIEYPTVYNAGIWFRDNDGNSLYVTKCGDGHTNVECRNEKGELDRYDLKKDLNYIAMTTNGYYVDVAKEPPNKDNARNDYYVYGNMHLTKNVRIFSSWAKEHIGFICHSMQRDTDVFPCYRYEHEELTDEQIKSIILEDLIYGTCPNLSERSCVGSGKKGLDNDVNYRNGTYTLNNGKVYTVTWCYGRISCREGSDNGWYHDKEKVGRVIFEDEPMDWEKYRTAVIRDHVINRVLQSGKQYDVKYPEVVDAVCEQIKGWERFKMGYEFEENENE